ncbi:MAG: class I SAM-dependent methyltransferase [Anaerolineales bacterium]|nr:class I SAM-dependent methyltransferase [Anaerolineales bacterium]
MENTEQTHNSFHDKWEQNRSLAFTETLKEGSDIFNWILNRNGFFSVIEFRQWLSKREHILDAGCGNGRVTALLKKYSSLETDILGIDFAGADVARENLTGLERVRVQQKDLLGDLADLGYFDLIYCQEVLHHTADPRGAFLNLCTRLNDKGEIAIYVYKKKAPLREYADDYVRSQISELPYEKAMESMRALTELGKILSDLKIKVQVPHVPVIGIEAGEYEIQRFIYHFFLKCFWNPSLSYEDNMAINYDWYHPQLCTRHTLEEVESWFLEAGLKIVHRYVDYYGITVRGIK